MDEEEQNYFAKFFQGIDQGDLDLIKEELDEIDHSETDADSYCYLSLRLFDRALQTNPKVISGMYDLLQEYNPVSKIGELVYLILFDQRFYPIASNIISNLKQVTFYELVLGLINYDPSDLLDIALTTVAKSFPKSNLKTYMDLLKTASEEKNYMVVRFIQEQLVRTNKVVPVPDYVLREKCIPPSIVPSMDEILDITLENLEENLTFEGSENLDEKESVRKFISQMSEEERKVFVDDTILGKFRQRLRISKAMFQAYGPINNCCDLEHPDYICSATGGCRMFTCLCLEKDEYNVDVMKDDWFTGHCAYCRQIIPERRWALRLPVLNGGWKGCYCSGTCAESNFFDFIDSSKKEISLGLTKEEQEDLEDEKSALDPEQIDSEDQISACYIRQIRKIVSQLDEVGVYEYMAGDTNAVGDGNEIDANDEDANSDEEGDLEIVDLRKDREILPFELDQVEKQELLSLSELSLEDSETVEDDMSDNMLIETPTGDISSRIESRAFSPDLFSPTSYHTTIV